MSFQTEIPPVPTREQEKEMISKIEQNFLAQPYYRHFGNEAIRTSRMDAYDKKNLVDKRFWFNYAVGLAVSGLFVLPLNRLSVRRLSGVPFYYRPKLSTNLVKTTYYHQHRAWTTTFAQTFLWLTLANVYAQYYTDRTPGFDEYYEDFRVKPVV